jgi:hypothetical protein
MQVSGQIHAPAALYERKEPEYPLHRWLHGLQSLSALRSKQKLTRPKFPEVKPDRNVTTAAHQPVVTMGTTFQVAQILNWWETLCNKLCLQCVPF